MRPRKDSQGGRAMGRSRGRPISMPSGTAVTRPTVRSRTVRWMARRRCIVPPGCRVVCPPSEVTTSRVSAGPPVGSGGPSGPRTSRPGGESSSW